MKRRWWRLCANLRTNRFFPPCILYYPHLTGCTSEALRAFTRKALQQGMAAPTAPTRTAGTAVSLNLAVATHESRLANTLVASGRLLKQKQTYTLHFTQMQIIKEAGLQMYHYFQIKWEVSFIIKEKQAPNSTCKSPNILSALSVVMCSKALLWTLLSFTTSTLGRTVIWGYWEL